MLPNVLPLLIGLTMSLMWPSRGPAQATFRVDVGVVTVGVRVIDKRGKAITGLDAKNFSLYDNGEPSKITYFSNRELPVSLVILLDRSSSMLESHKIERAKKAALTLVRSSHPQTEILFIPFNHFVPQAVGFTQDRHLTESEINATVAGGGTSLYNATWEALDWCARAHQPRQILVVISDGADENSQVGLDPTLLHIKDSQVEIYTIGYYSPREAGAFRTSGEEVFTKDRKGWKTYYPNPRRVLERMAAASGGKAYFPESDKDLRRAVKDISNDLQTQYTLAFYPPSGARPGVYRSIKVEVDRKGVKVQSRPGYTYLLQR